MITIEEKLKNLIPLSQKTTPLSQWGQGTSSPVKNIMAMGKQNISTRLTFFKKFLICKSYIFMPKYWMSSLYIKVDKLIIRNLKIGYMISVIMIREAKHCYVLLYEKFHAHLQLFIVLFLLFMLYKNAVKLENN